VVDDIDETFYLSSSLSGSGSLDEKQHEEVHNLLSAKLH